MGLAVEDGAPLIGVLARRLLVPRLGELMRRHGQTPVEFLPAHILDSATQRWPPQGIGRGRGRLSRRVPSSRAGAGKAAVLGKHKVTGSTPPLEIHALHPF